MAELGGHLAITGQVQGREVLRPKIDILST